MLHGREALRSAQLRATAPRLAVLACLEAASTPLTHAEVHAALLPQGLDRATVYRNLVDLVEAGLATKRDLGDHLWRFERTSSATDEHEHPHFVCVECGQIECLPEATVAVRPSADVPRAFADQRLDVQLRGRCDGCF